MPIRYFRVVAPQGVTFPEGTVLVLTPEQVAPRAHNLIEADDGMQATRQLSFKAGEVFGVNADSLNRLALIGLEDVNGDAPEPPKDEPPAAPSKATRPYKRRAAK